MEDQRQRTGVMKKEKRKKIGIGGEETV